MDKPSNPLPAEGDYCPLPQPGPLRATFRAIRRRTFSGLLAALPIAITFWIIYWLYSTLKEVVLDPIAHLVKELVGPGRLAALPPWWEQFLAPVLSIAIVLVFLYFLGLFVRTRFYRAFDWVMTRVPVVTMIYKASRDVVRTLDHGGFSRFKRVVLVPFPHPGAKGLGFVTQTLRDTGTQKTILCVCVLTSVVPPAGFTFFVPEDDVIDIDWTINETLQVILSGGMTAPTLIPYYHGGPTRLIVPGGDRTGPLNDQPAAESPVGLA